jgi:hypothetical protein
VNHRNRDPRIRVQATESGGNTLRPHRKVAREFWFSSMTWPQHSVHPGHLIFVPEAVAQENRTQTRYFEREWEFEGIEVATLVRWLERIGVELPVTLEGEISGALAIGVPWNDLGNSRAWRFAGRVSSPRFRVNGLAFEAS